MLKIKQDKDLLQEIQNRYVDENNIDNLCIDIEKDIFRLVNEMISNKLYLDKNNNIRLQYEIYQLHIYKLFLSFCDYIGYFYISDIPSDIVIYNDDYQRRLKYFYILQYKCKENIDNTYKNIICKL